MIPGVTMNIGGKEYIVPPLSLAQTRALHTSGRLGSVPWNGAGLLLSLEHYQAAVDVILQAMRRNYPELTATEIEDGLDLASVGDVLRACLGAAGLTQGASGEARSP